MIMLWMGMWTGMGEGIWGMGMGEDDVDDVESTLVAIGLAAACHATSGATCQKYELLDMFAIVRAISLLLLLLLLPVCLSVCPSSCLSAVYTSSFCACRACRRSGDKRPLYLWDTQWPLYLRGASLFADRCCICCSTLSSTFPSHIFPHNISKFVELPKNSKTA